MSGVASEMEERRIRRWELYTSEKTPRDPANISPRRISFLLPSRRSWSFRFMAPRIRGRCGLAGEREILRLALATPLIANEGFGRGWEMQRSPGNGNMLGREIFFLSRSVIRRFLSLLRGRRIDVQERRVSCLRIYFIFVRILFSPLCHTIISEQTSDISGEQVLVGN